MINLQLDENQMRIILEQLGKCHAICYFKSDVKGQEELKLILEYLQSFLKKSGNFDLFESVFTESKNKN